MKKHTPIVALIAACSLALILAGTACRSQEQAASTDTADEQQEQPSEDAANENGEVESTGDTPTDDETTLPRDPADPPNATVALAGDESVSTAPIPCSSTWTFEQDGEPMTVTTEAPHPVQYEANGMPSLSVSGSAEVVARFDEPATAVEVTRYLEADISAAAAEKGSAYDLSASDVIGEVIDAQVTDGVVTFNAESGYRYALEVSFDRGIAIYVFTVTE